MRWCLCLVLFSACVETEPAASVRTGNIIERVYDEYSYVKVCIDGVIYISTTGPYNLTVAIGRDGGPVFCEE